jgi:hypothetical protein
MPKTAWPQLLAKLYHNLLFPNLILKVCHGAASVLQSSFLFKRLGVWFYFEKVRILVLVLEVSKILLRLGSQFYAGFLLG